LDQEESAVDRDGCSIRSRWLLDSIAMAARFDRRSVRRRAPIPALTNTTSRRSPWRSRAAETTAADERCGD